MESKRKINKITMIGILIIIISIDSLLLLKAMQNYKTQKEEKKVITFINNYDNSKDKPLNNTSNKEENYLMVIEIPKINLRGGIYNKDSKLNVVDKNITILNESDMPDQENGNVIIVGHSGTGRTAYFNKLPNIEKNDIVNIYYNNMKYKYEVVKKYDVEKTGRIELEDDNSNSILTLITCDKHDITKQIVIICNKK